MYFDRVVLSLNRLDPNNQKAFMPKNKKNSKPRFKLTYKGSSFKDTQDASAGFWSNVSPAQKIAAITDVIYESYLLKGIDFHALRLLRTTAIIRKP